MELIHLYFSHIVTFLFAHKFGIMSLIGGVFPALVWMLFWLREDECTEEIVDPIRNRTLICMPEPKSLIAVTFVLGALTVPIAYTLQKGSQILFGLTGLPLLLLWSFIEESLKYGMYVWIDSRSAYIDKPIDPLVYMTIIALGFSSFENTIFLYHSLTNTTISEAIIGQDMRIIGASLLHVLASGTIGLVLGFAYFKARNIQRIIGFFALIFATLLHTLFNYFIISNSGAYTLHVFGTVWIFGAVFLALIERLRYITFVVHNNQ